MINKDITTRDFIKGVGTGTIALITGCRSNRKPDTFRTGRNSRYTSNAGNDMNSRKFGDRQFDASANIVNIAGKEYSFFPLSNYDVSLGNAPVDKSTLFPYAAVDRAIMVEDVDPVAGTHHLMYEDGSAIVFQRDPTITHLSTEIAAERKTLREGKRVGSVGESRFKVPLLDFGKDSHLRNVAYGTDTDMQKEENIILVSDPKFRINHALGDGNKGLVQFFSRNGGNFFVENVADLSYVPPAPVMPQTKATKPIKLVEPPKRQNYVPVRVNRTPVN